MTAVRRGRQYPDGPIEAPPGWPEGAGEFMFSLFGGGTEPEPGPPYVHTLIPPEPVGCDDEGEPVWLDPAPAYTLTKRPLTELIDPALPAWLVRAAAACSPKPSPLRQVAARAVANPVQIGIGEAIGPGDEFRWMPYRFEVIPDESSTGCYFPLDDAPAPAPAGS